MSKVPKPERTTRKRRLNPRALILCGVVLLAALPGVIGLQILQNRRGGAALLAEARKATAQGKPGTALGFLNRYLELHPDDLPALDEKAKILADAATDPERAAEAVQVHTRAVGLAEKLVQQAPTEAEKDKIRARWVETRRRLVRLSTRSPQPDQVKAVEAQADTLIAELQKAGKLDAEALTLRARASEAVAQYVRSASEQREALDQARAFYQRAEALEPGNVEGAAGLAELYLDRLKDTEGAEKSAAEVIDRAVAGTAPGPDAKANAKYDPKRHAAALLLRARFKNRQASPLRVGGEISREQRDALIQSAQTDLDEAFRLDPDNVDVHVVQADMAVQRRDIVTARRYVESLPKAQRDRREVKLLEAHIDLVDHHPEAAIRTYRAGLLQARGNDVEMTQQLLLVLLDLGWVDDDTRALLDQYVRIGQAAVPPASRVGAAEHEEELRRFNARCDYLRGLFWLKSNRPAKALELLEPLARNPPSEFRLQFDYFLGTAYLGQGNVEKARDAYRQATERAPSWPAPWLALARLDEAERPAQAVATLRAGLANTTDDPTLLAELGDLLLRETARPGGQAARVSAEVEDILKRADRPGQPLSPDVVLLRARHLAANNRVDDAIAALEAASARRPQSAELWKARVNVEIGRGRFARALELLDQATAAAGPHADFAIARAGVLVREGELTRACDTLADAVSRVPGDQQAVLWRSLGDLRQGRGEFARAREAFASWAGLEPDNPAPRLALFNLALTEGNDAEIDRAVKAVQDVTGERGAQVRYARVQSLLRDRPGAPPLKQRLDEADAIVADVIKDDPKLPLGYYLRGRVAERRGEVDRAIAAYTQAVDLRAGNDVLGPLVALLVRQNRTADLEALKTKPGVSAAAVDQMAAVQALRSGDRSQAERLAALAVSGDPQGFDVRNWQAQVFRALGKPKEAEDAFKKLVAEDPGNLAHRLQLLMLQASQGRNADAAATVDAARAAIKPESYAKLNLDLVWAQCYRAAGAADRAAELAREALRKQPSNPDVFRAVVLLLNDSGSPRLKAEAAELLQAVYDRDKTNGWVRRQLAESLAGRVNDRAAWEKALAVIGPDTRPDDAAEDKLTRARVYSQSPTAADRRKAIAILEKLAAELPGLATVREQLARLLLADRRIPEARTHAEAAAGPAAGPDTVLFYAGVLLAAKDFDGVAKQLERLERIDPAARPVAELKAKLLAQQNRPAEAAAVIEKLYDAQAGAPDAAELGDALVTMLHDLGRADAALRLAQKVAATGPRGRCVLARVRAQSGHADDAAALLDQAATADPAAATTTALLLALTPKADPRWLAAADRYVTRALELRPASEDPREKQARLDLLDKQALVRHIQGRFDQEVAVYQAMLALKPAAPLFLNNMAWTLSEELHNPQEALRWVDESLRTLGPQAAILDTRGVILGRLGKHAEALADLEAAAQATPTPSFLFHLARAYQKLNRADDARAARDRARDAGLTRDQLQPSELADWDAVMTR